MSNIPMVMETVLSSTLFLVYTVGLKRVLGYPDSGRFLTRTGYFMATRVLGTFHFDKYKINGIISVVLITVISVNRVDHTPNVRSRLFCSQFTNVCHVLLHPLNKVGCTLQECLSFTVKTTIINTFKLLILLT